VAVALRSWGALVVAALLVVAAPLIFFFAALIGLQPFEENQLFAYVVVLLIAFALGMTAVVAAGVLAYRTTRSVWLTLLPYAVGILVGVMWLQKVSFAIVCLALIGIPAVILAAAHFGERRRSPSSA